MAPKRAPSAYVLYGKDKRPEAVERATAENGGGKPAAPLILKTIAAMWKEESEDVKEKYAALAAAAKEEFDKNKPAEEPKEDKAKTAPKAKSAPLPKAGPTSAFMAFCADKRKDITEKMMAEKPDEGKPGMGPVQKELAAAWKELSEEQKKPYEETAAKNKEAAAKIKEAKAADREAVDEVADSLEAGATPGSGLPHSTVRKIVLLDKDVHRITKDGVTMICATVELYLSLLAGAAFKECRARRKTTLKVDDLKAAMKRQKRLRDSPMADEMFGDDRGDDSPMDHDDDEEPVAKAPRAKKSKAATKAGKAASMSKTISSFFAKKPKEDDPEGSD